MKILTTHHTLSLNKSGEKYKLELNGESITLDITDIARIRNECSRLLDAYRSTKREREKRSKQKEIDLDR